MILRENFFVDNFVQNLDMLRILKNTLYLQRLNLTILVVWLLFSQMKTNRYKLFKTAS